MDLLVRHSDYALRVLVYIAAGKGRVVSAKELKEALGLPYAFIRKICQVLQLSGYLFSFKGKGGGFCLKKKADKIFILDVLRLFQGGVNFTHCCLRGAPCPNRKRCPIRMEVKDAERLVIKRLRNVTVDYLRNRGGKDVLFSMSGGGGEQRLCGKRGVRQRR
ncbi:MAG: RrF2 family transcriptional regulator [Candidatus Omnitrophota bacterium]